MPDLSSYPQPGSLTFGKGLPAQTVLCEEGGWHWLSLADGVTIGRHTELRENCLAVVG
jgi:hypothetical protein